MNALHLYRAAHNKPRSKPSVVLLEWQAPLGVVHGCCESGINAVCRALHYVCRPMTQPFSPIYGLSMYPYISPRSPKIPSHCICNCADSRSPAAMATLIVYSCKFLPLLRGDSCMGHALCTEARNAIIKAGSSDIMQVILEKSAFVISASIRVTRGSVCSGLIPRQSKTFQSAHPARSKVYWANWAGWAEESLSWLKESRLNSLKVCTYLHLAPRLYGKQAIAIMVEYALYIITPISDSMHPPVTCIPCYELVVRPCQSIMQSFLQIDLHEEIEEATDIDIEESCCEAQADILDVNGKLKGEKSLCAGLAGCAQ